MAFLNGQDGFIFYLSVFRFGGIAISGLLVYCGYKLFLENTKNMGAAEFSGAGFAFKATKLGPGLVFAIAGAICVWKSFDISATFSSSAANMVRSSEEADDEPSSGVVSISGHGESGGGDRLSVSLNDLRDMCQLVFRLRESKGVTELDRHHVVGLDSILGRVTFEIPGIALAASLKSRPVESLTKEESELLLRLGGFLRKEGN